MNQKYSERINMIKIILLMVVTVTFIFSGCGTPNEPETLFGDDGGYKIVSRYSTPGFAQDVLVKDTLAYIAQGQGGLLIVNIKNPENPKLVSELTYGLRGYSYKIASKDSIVYLAAGLFGVHSVNVANPLNPVITQENRAISPAKNFHIMNDYLFTAVSEEGINITKILDPAHPDIRQTFFVPGYAQSVSTSTDNNYLLVASGEVGFTIFDISDFQDGYNIYPVLHWIDTPGYAEDVAVHPDFPVAFLACGTGGLIIADYSDTASVKIIGSYNSGGYAKEVIYKDNKVYLTTELRGLQIFDVSDLTSPVRIGTVQTQFSLGVAIDDNYVYLADDKEGLIIISIPR